MRHSAGANESGSIASYKKISRELGHAQIVSAEGDDDVGGNRFLLHPVVVPNDAREAQHFLVHRAGSGRRATV